MNLIRTVRRPAVILTWLPCTLLVSIAAAPVALAAPSPHHSARLRVPFPPVLPAGWYKHPSPPLPAHTAITAGMPGWQITLIAAGAIALAALAALVLRARAARHQPTATAT
jgi:hypothetical protein